MFYSQFILAKKGPLGTIWIAAHLERKLRKNQVADTDIGVSVDSILFPEVPIALRLSSHLLLGVVRIYSRKVNYLFHDCSEALLKVKQAFRSTAVDLPPEESTAPYHSITLPETFDLDDFELPDSDIFQGNYVDHHISTREQITLQDNMDGVVYSTSKFGLDERFGDGDTSQIGLDLDEELFLDKINMPGHTDDLLDPDDMDPQETQPTTPFSKMDIDEHLNESADDKRGDDLEAMKTDADEEHINPNYSHEGTDKPLNNSTHDPKLNENGFPSEQDGADPSEKYAQATSASNLAEEMILSNGHFEESSTVALIKDTSLHNSSELVRQDDNGNLLAESERCESTQAVIDENPANCSSKTDLHIKDTNDAGYCSLLDKSSESSALLMLNDESTRVKQLNQVDSPSVNVLGDTISTGANGSTCSPTSVLAESPKPSSPASECLAPTDGGERFWTPQNGAVADNAPSGSFVSQTDAGTLSTLVTSVDSSGMSISAEACGGPPTGAESACLMSNSTNNCLSKETCEPHASVNEDHLQESCSPNLALPSFGESQLGASEHDVDKNEVKACSEPEDREINGSTELDGMLGPDNYMLTASNSVQKEYDMLPTEGEGSPLEVLGKETQLTSSKMSALLQGEGFDSTRDQGVPSDANSKDNQSDNLNQLSNCDFPAPEVLLSAPVAVADVPSDFLSSEKEVPPEVEGNRLEILSGKEFPSTESTPLLQNDSSAKLSGVSRSKRTLESVPDDDDLLSSILVGRRSASLKMRSTPLLPEIPSCKRPRLNPRATPKRKVLLDDTMVLHGDTIRQQLTGTEDIRRTRRKAPCTRPEIWMIQQHFLEDEVFHEPVFTGVTAELISLHNGKYDLTNVRVCDIAVGNAFSEVQNNAGFTVDHCGVTGIDNEPPIASGNHGKILETGETQMVAEDHSSQSLPIFHEGHDAHEKRYPLDETHDLQRVGQSVVTEKQDKEDAHMEEHGTVIGDELPILTDPAPDDRCNASSSPMNSLIDATKDHVKDRTIDGGDACEMEEMNGENIALINGPNDESVNRETGIVSSDRMVSQNLSQDFQYDLGDATNCLGIANTVDSGSVENSVDMTDLPAQDQVKMITMDMCLGDGGPMIRPCVTDEITHEKIRSEFGNVVEDEVLNSTTGDGFGHDNPQLMHNKELQRESSFPSGHDVSTENIPPQFDELYDDLRTMEEDNAATNNASVRVSDDFGSTMDGNDTGFLNFDDDDDDAHDEEDNGMPTEESHLLDNSGWSSRTRAVAKFLQTLFEKESGSGRKLLPMDNLLSGKTRKEASRMFFETLVLKTRDYIHVEQEIPFDSINIKPNVKLMKSEF
ncbi:hypothetical protein Syun_005757 [Stephania yunnanensis]|uniref:Sister chromatid cohesion 1 protein 4-like n=1 Tax=Stephania yunnanensis TaxID=152371 RepID=A0AAP0Q0P8_9MAGN